MKVVSICDVDRAHLDSAADELQQLQDLRPTGYKLYEEILMESNKEFVDRLKSGLTEKNLPPGLYEMLEPVMANYIKKSFNKKSLIEMLNQLIEEIKYSQN